jgi:hypothetical protein
MSGEPECGKAIKVAVVALESARIIPTVKNALECKVVEYYRCSSPSFLLSTS